MAPYQKPVYKNGRCTNALVAPISFNTSISARLDKIFKRMVLPVINNTELNNSTDTTNTASLKIERIPSKRANHIISSLPCWTSGSRSNLANNSCAAIDVR